MFNDWEVPPVMPVTGTKRWKQFSNILLLWITLHDLNSEFRYVFWKDHNKNIHVIQHFCDLVKAFDCVNHDILLAKLRYYRIQGVSEDWYRSNLTNRRQKVEVKSPNTTFFLWLVYIEKWVPQGSIRIDPWETNLCCS
jgi:hypothetical protein